MGTLWPRIAGRECDAKLLEHAKAAEAQSLADDADDVQKAPSVASKRNEQGQSKTP